jgi:hypothetical protein
MPVGIALNFVAAFMASEGLTLVDVSVFGMRGTPTQPHRLATLRATGLIGRAEGA